MGATNIERTVKQEDYTSPQAAFNALTIKALDMYGTDPYSGTIATTDLVGKVEQPSSPAEYENILNKLDKRECVYFDDGEGYWVFVGWAAT
jgi:hypothetical protein